MRRFGWLAGACVAVCLAGAASGAVAEEAGPSAGVRKVTLEEAVNLALAQNPDVLRAKQEIERARGVVIQARASLLPRLQLAASYRKQDEGLLDRPAEEGSGGASTAERQAALEAGFVGLAGAVPGSPQAAAASGLAQALAASDSQSSGGGFFPVQDDAWRVALEVRQLLYAGGRVRAENRLARIEEDISFYGLRDTIDAVVSAVRKGFYRVLVTRALITVQEESVRLLEEELEDQRKRFEAGTVPQFNVLRAEVELSNVKPALIRARNARTIARLELARLLGLEYATGTRDVRPPVDAEGTLAVAPADLNLPEALARARAQRASLKARRQAVLAEGERIKVALAGYKPRLSAAAGYEWENSRFSEEIDDLIDGWFVGVEGSWNLFDGFETYGLVKQARARLEAARIAYEDAARGVDLEVQEAYSRVLEARESIRSQEKGIGQALEALRLARERLAAGAGTQLDVLDARVALTRARTTELEARFDYNLARADLDRAVGDATQFEPDLSDPLVPEMRKRMTRP